MPPMYDWTLHFRGVRYLTETPSSDDESEYDFEIFYEQGAGKFVDKGGNMKDLDDVRSLPIKSFHVRSQGNVYAAMNSYERGVVREFTKELMAGRLKIDGSFDCANRLRPTDAETFAVVRANRPVPIIFPDTKIVTGTKENVMVRRGAYSRVLHIVHLEDGDEVTFRRNRLYLVGSKIGGGAGSMSHETMRAGPEGTGSAATREGSPGELSLVVDDQPAWITPEGQYHFSISVGNGRKSETVIIPVGDSAVPNDFTHMVLHNYKHRRGSLSASQPHRVGRIGSAEWSTSPRSGTFESGYDVFVSRSEIVRSIENVNSDSSCVVTACGIVIEPAVIKWFNHEHMYIDCGGLWRNMMRIWKSSARAWDLHQIAGLMRLDVRDVIAYLDEYRPKYPIHSESGCYLPMACRSVEGVMTQPMRLSDVLEVSVFKKQGGLVDRSDRPLQVLSTNRTCAHITQSVCLNRTKITTELMSRLVNGDALETSWCIRGTDDQLRQSGDFASRHPTISATSSGGCDRGVTAIYVNGVGGIRYTGEVESAYQSRVAPARPW